MRDEIIQDGLRREAEAKLIAELSMILPDGLISTALKTYLDNPWMEEEIFSRDFHSEEDIDIAIQEIVKDGGLG